MRVLILIDSLDSGGAESAVVPLARQLDRARIQPDFVALFSIYDKRRLPTTRIIDALGNLDARVAHINAHNLRDLNAFRRLLDEIRSQEIELVHAHLTFSIIWGALAAERLGLPFIGTLHGFIDPPRGSRQWLWEQLDRLALRHANRVICVSDALRNFYLDRTKLNPRRVLTLYNGLELDRFDANQVSRSAIRHDLGLGEGVPVVAMVALLRPGKGHDELLGAIPGVLDIVPDARFLIVGGGQREAELRAAARAFGDSVIFLGMRDDVPAVLSASDLLVLPSHSEALPTVLLEGMAARLPVVASSVGGIPEIVRHGETGTLVPPHDSVALAQAILSLLENRERAREMGQAGRRRVEALFDSGLHAERLAGLYEQVRDEHGQRRTLGHRTPGQATSVLASDDDHSLRQ